MSCDRTAQVHAYHDGELPPGERVRLEQHLESCAECRDLLSQLRRLTAALAEAVLPAMPVALGRRLKGALAARRDRDLRRLAEWLTTAAAAILLGGLLMLPRGGNETRRPTITLDVSPVMPPIEPLADKSTETVHVAQWMADDLTRADTQELP